MVRQHLMGLIVVAVVATMGCANGSDDGTAPSGTREVTVGLCFPPTWFAYRNESGNWTRISPVTNELSFKATPRAAIAVVYADFSYASTEVFFLSAEQLDAIACTMPASSGTKSLGGTISGIFSPWCEGPTVTMAGQPWFLGPPDIGFYHFSLSSLPDGPHDLIAACTVRSGLPYTQLLLLRRGVDLPDGAELPRLDMAGPESFAPTVNTIQISGLDPAELYTTVHHTFRASGTSVELKATDGTIRSVPLEHQLPGDLHELYVDSWPADRRTLRFVTRFHRAPADVTIELGEALTIPTNTVIVDGPYTRIRTTLPSQSGYGSVVTAYYQQGNDQLSLTISPDFTGGIPANWIFEIPDLTQVPGFVPSWGLQTGQYAWRVEALAVPPTHPIPFFSVTDWKPQDGDVIRGAYRQGGN